MSRVLAAIYASYHTSARDASRRGAECGGNRTSMGELSEKRRTRGSEKIEDAHFSIRHSQLRDRKYFILASN